MKFRAGIILFTLVAAASCTTVPAGPKRARTELPLEMAVRYAKSKTQPTFILDKRNPTADFTQFRGKMISENGAETPFEFFRPNKAGNFPFILVLPYLEGSYFFPRTICKFLSRNGFCAAFLERPGNVLAPNQPAGELEALTRAAVIRYRDFLDWAGERPEVEKNKMGFVGISMGSFVGTVLIAADPRISRAVLALPGCDLPKLLCQSREIKILDYMKSCLKDGKRTESEIVTEFEHDFQSDPKYLAPYLDNSGLLVISARYDKTIPREFSDKIWTLLGQPTRIWLPTGHGTAGFCLLYIENKILEHFRNWQAP